MFDVNKTFMHCLVKNFAMLELGIYTYFSEDLLEIEMKKITAEGANILKNIIRKIDDGNKDFK